MKAPSLFKLKLILIFLMSSSIVCCNSSEEKELSFFPEYLDFEEFTVPIPPYMTNAWNVISEVHNSDTKNIVIWDDYKKSFFEYSIDKGQVVDSLVLNGDTLNLNGFNIFSKNEKGYFISTNFDFYWLDNKGQLLSNWSKIPKGRNPLKSNDFSKVILSYDGLRQSVLNETTLPLTFRLINEFGMGVYENSFYEFPVLGSLNMETGEVSQFDVYFPKEEFKVGEESFPTKAFLSFTSCGPNCLAYIYGINEKIYFLNTKSGEVKSHSLRNEYFNVIINPISKSNFEDNTIKAEYFSKISTYSKIYYNPYNQGFVRIGEEKTQGSSRYICEIISKELEIISYMYLPQNYMKRPIFFEDEILFLYFQGYKEDEMKFLRIRLDSN